MTKVLLVNYTGGYCGNFFTHLLADAVDYPHGFSSDERNAYYFKNFEVDTIYVKFLGKLFEARTGELDVDAIQSVSGNENDSYRKVIRIFNLVNDEDDECFIENVKSYYEQIFEGIKSKYFVSCVHYTSPYKSFRIKDVLPEAIVVHLYASNPRHHRLFNTIFHYKSITAEIDRALVKDTLSDLRLEEECVNPHKSLVPLYDKTFVNVDVGKVLFNRDEDELVKFESTMERLTGDTVKINRKDLFDYADRNDAALRSIIGDEYLTCDESLSVERNLEYLTKLRELGGIK